MILLDIYLQWGPMSDGVEEQFDLFEAGNALGEAAFASPNQMFVLTEVEFDVAARRLADAAGESVFVKVQEVAGRFLLSGPYPEAVHALIERAGGAGAVSIGWSNPPNDAPPPEQVETPSGWIH